MALNSTVAKAGFFHAREEKTSGPIFQELAMSAGFWQLSWLAPPFQTSRAFRSPAPPCTKTQDRLWAYAMTALAANRVPSITYSLASRSRFELERKIEQNWETIQKFVIVPRFVDLGVSAASFFSAVRLAAAAAAAAVLLCWWPRADVEQSQHQARDMVFLPVFFQGPGPHAGGPPFSCSILDGMGGRSVCTATTLPGGCRALPAGVPVREASGSAKPSGYSGRRQADGR